MTVRVGERESEAEGRAGGSETNARETTKRDKGGRRDFFLMELWHDRVNFLFFFSLPLNTGLLVAHNR